MSTQLSVQSSLLFGWKTFKARPWLFVGSIVVYAAVQCVLMLLEKLLPGILVLVANLAIGTLLAIGLMSLYLKAHDNLEGAVITDMWNPKPFWQYLATSIVIAVLVILGAFVFIIPGIILAIAFSMAPYLVIEKRLWTMPALKESWRITSGNWLKLLLMSAAIVIMNVIGMALLLVGLLVTAPISMLAMVHVFRTLSGTSGKLEESASPESPAAALAA